MQIPIHFHPNGNFTQRTNYHWIDMRCTIWTSHDFHIFPNVSLIHYGGHWNIAIATAAGFQPNIHYYSFWNFTFGFFFFNFHFPLFIWIRNVNPFWNYVQLIDWWLNRIISAHRWAASWSTLWLIHIILLSKISHEKNQYALINRNGSIDFKLH